MPNYDPIHSYPDATNVKGVSGGGREPPTKIMMTLTKKNAKAGKDIFLYYQNV